MSTRFSTHRIAPLLLLALSLPLAAQHSKSAPETKPPATHVDQPAQLADAQQLLTLLHTDLIVNQNSTKIQKQISDAAEKVAGSSPTPENKTKLDDFQKNTSQIIDAQMGWKAVQPAFADLYAKAFTEQEMKAILAFYQSPAGAAFLDKTPSINDQIRQIMNARMATLQPQLNQLYTDFRKSQTPEPTPAAPATSAAPATPAAPAKGTLK